MIRVALLATAAVLVLGACGEKPQIASGIKSDAAPFQGTGMPFVTSGWKPGDKTSWDQQLKTRTQNGQNDYVKTP